MKVIQFVPTLDSGGVEQGVLEMSRALVENNHESHVVSAGGRLVDQLIQNGTHHHKWDLHKKNIFTFKHVKPLRKWIMSIRSRYCACKIKNACMDSLAGFKGYSIK